jgi:hypothetical protein
MNAQHYFIAIGIGLLAMGMSIWQLSIPEILSSYDSGVYLAASIHLISGVVPYRDFDFVQPPGIMILMSPVALFSKVFGTHDGYILARITSGAVSSGNVALLAWLLRPRGRTAMLLGGAVLAFLPDAHYVTSSLTLEPYCLFFVLLGAVVLLANHGGSESIAPRRLVTGGVLFGIGALVKLWAFFPFAAIVICLSPQYRSKIRYVIAGAAGVFAAVSLPFFVLAPRNYVSEVIVQQLLRKSNVYDRASIFERLIRMTGYSSSPLAPTGRAALVIFLILIALVVLAFRRWRRIRALDLFFILAAGITAAGLLITSVSNYYYGYFTAPFLIGLAVISLQDLSAPLLQQIRTVTISTSIRMLVVWGTVISTIGLLFAFTLYTTTNYSRFAWGLGLNTPWFAAISKYVPENSCVVYSEVSYGLMTNRFQANAASCPDVVDPYGMWLANGYHRVNPSSTFVNQWKSYFASAEYAVLNSPNTGLIPWNSSLFRWFDDHYRLLYHKNYIFIFKRVV